MKKKILIIDDDRDFVESIKIILEKDYEVEVRYTTEYLIKNIKLINPDAIILDVMFPDDPDAGFTAAQLIAGDKETSRIPIAILSAVNQMSNLALPFSNDDAGHEFMPVWEFVEKPVEPKKLHDLIKTLLRS